MRRKAGGTAAVESTICYGRTTSVSIAESHVHVFYVWYLLQVIPDIYYWD
jgi:hypothetical protein